MRARPLKITITTGDPDGIGFEIAEKALWKLGPQPGVHFLIWRGASSYPKTLRHLRKKFSVISFSDEFLALEYLRSEKMAAKTLVELVSAKPPALWVQTSAQWCCADQIDGLVTGPISKTEIHKAGLKDMGHTDILKRVSKTPDVYMGFIGERFNVLLATSHIPIAKVAGSLSLEGLAKALRAADSLRTMLPLKQRHKPIGLLGLNPHAGESGLIGSEEADLHVDLIRRARKLKIPVVGPLVPDAAFQEENWKKYSVYLAMYHDQGLIPFKMIHGQENGVHVSVGLPFVRTSVDHGTAKDIFGKNKANAASMIDAIQACLRLVKSSIR
jgi:4-hydroxythreonine-4-phosphate dehydrogenase